MISKFQNVVHSDMPRIQRHTQRSVDVDDPIQT